MLYYNHLFVYINMYMYMLMYKLNVLLVDLSTLLIIHDFLFHRWQNDWDPFLLSRGTVGRDRSSYIATWHVKMTYKLKVITAKNCNVQDTMKVTDG